MSEPYNGGIKDEAVKNVREGIPIGELLGVFGAAHVAGPKADAAGCGDQPPAGGEFEEGGEEHEREGEEEVLPEEKRGKESGGEGKAHGQGILACVGPFVNGW